jgi:hypothetical protein
MEEHRRRALEKTVRKRIFIPKTDEVVGCWRKFHNEDFHNIYSSPTIIRVIKTRRMRWEGHPARMGMKRSTYRVLVRNPE